MNVATAGAGPAILLLHGFPHTWEVWSRIIPALAKTHFVIAPDLRGHGGTSRAADGYDLATLTADALGLLDALHVDETDIVAMDVGAPTALYLALEHPGRVRRLILMEGILGDLPRTGATSGLPWWFAFHGIPGLAEVVLAGHEDEYIGYFLDNGVRGNGLTPELRARFIDSYRGTDSLRCGFQYYRNLDFNARLINASIADHRLTVPTMTVGAHPIGAGLYEQLRSVADEIYGHLITDCGHVIPIDRPSALLDLITPFLA